MKEGRKNWEWKGGRVKSKNLRADWSSEERMITDSNEDKNGKELLPE